jgi:hypothetical protein
MPFSSSFRFAADVVIAVHAGFVLFVVLGGVLALRWRWMVWLHAPAVAWGAVIEYANWVCPLTPLENYLRQRSGGAVYPGDFIDHYVVPLLYPTPLTREGQMLAGTLVLAVNAVVYWRLLTMRSSR